MIFVGDFFLLIGMLITSYSLFGNIKILKNLGNYSQPRKRGKKFFALNEFSSQK